MTIEVWALGSFTLLCKVCSGVNTVKKQDKSKTAILVEYEKGKG